MALLGWPFGTPSLVYSVLRSAHLTITVVGQICIPEVAQKAHLTSRFTEGYLPLGRGTHWTLTGLPIAGAESPLRFPVLDPKLRYTAAWWWPACGTCKII